MWYDLKFLIKRATDMVSLVTMKLGSWLNKYLALGFLPKNNIIRPLVVFHFPVLTEKVIEYHPILMELILAFASVKITLNE